MLTFEANKTATVAAGTRAALARYDDAIGSAASLTLSFLDAVQDSDLPANEIQKFVQTVHESTGELISGRASMVSAAALLTSMKRRSNQSSMDVGCPGSGPWSSANRPQGLRLVAEGR